jgi:hypothetical protein
MLFQIVPVSPPSTPLSRCDQRNNRPITTTPAKHCGCLHSILIVSTRWLCGRPPKLRRRPGSRSSRRFGNSGSAKDTFQSSFGLTRQQAYQTAGCVPRWHDHKGDDHARISRFIDDRGHHRGRCRCGAVSISEACLGRVLYLCRTPLKRGI